jgi:hypothetical protein
MNLKEAVIYEDKEHWERPPDEDDKQMWPTPSASLSGENEEYLASLESKDGGPVKPNERIYDPVTGRHVQVSLNRAVKLFPGEDEDAPEEDEQTWPTPRSRDWKGTDHSRDENRSGKRHSGDDLATAVDKQERWPTPTVYDADGRPPRPAMDPAEARKERGGSCYNLREWVHGRPDAEDAPEMKDNWPTPTAGMHKQDVNDDGRFARDIAEKGFQLTLAAKVKLEGERQEGPAMLNPDWVDWLMGWPVGWTNPDPLPDGMFELWARMSVAGIWWKREPPGIPRVTTNKRDRTNRLKADGNGQVALCAAASCVALFENLWQADEAFRRAVERPEIDLDDFLDI